MPRTLYDEKGNPFEVPEESEVEELKTAAQKATDLEAELEDAKQAANPNFKAMRDREKRLKDALKASGKDVDDEGNIIDTTVLTKESIEQITAKTVTETQFNIEKTRALAQFAEKDREVVEYYLKKLMAGEEQTIENLYKFTKEATRMAIPDSGNRVADRIGAPLGGAPVFNNSSAASESTVAMGNAFGLSEDDIKAGGEIKY